MLRFALILGILLISGGDGVLKGGTLHMQSDVLHDSPVQANVPSSPSVDEYQVNTDCAAIDTTPYCANTNTKVTQDSTGTCYDLPGVSAGTFFSFERYIAYASGWYCASDGNIYVTPTIDTLHSWDTSTFLKVTDEAIATTNFRGNVVFRSRSYLVSLAYFSESTVWAVGPCGELYKTKDEETLQYLYGKKWLDSVRDVLDAFVLPPYNYGGMGKNELPTDNYPPSTVVFHPVTA